LDKTKIRRLTGLEKLKIEEESHMFSAKRRASVLAVGFALLLGGVAYGFVVDDEVPDVTARVARISFLKGDVQVRHAGAQDWEKVVPNLPLVEGDELTTSTDSRFEIEFDSRTFVRVAEASYLRIVTLKDEGIALSLPEGSMSARINDFDRDRTFFEVDIPKTTIAFQRAGLYRIDAGPRDSVDAHIRVTDGGEARVYSENAGFTLKNGRAATVFLAGNNIGEWETADASPFTDDFDTWTLDRDSTIAKRLKDAYYDKYYDRDIYGAEDLSDYGEWVYTRKYGYVWRPYSASLSPYADWSPYRYGHWRWIPPFGWTWVNDEPWGWATYHWGRWVWDDWYWSPYGYYRYRRSWWQPAYVYITIYNNNVCWYPLSYHHRYYDYNRHYYGRRDDRRNPPSSGGGAAPTPTPGPVGGQTNDARRQRGLTPPLLRDLPPGSVVTVSTDDFGKSRTGIRRAPLDVAREVLSKTPDEAQTPPILPSREQVEAKLTKEIKAEPPPIARIDTTVKTGAAQRSNDQPMDEELRKSRILGNRAPVRTAPPPLENTPVVQETNKPRDTGAVNRPVLTQKEKPAAETPPYVPPTRNEDRKVEQTEQKQEQPRYEPPRKETPRYEPKNDAPVYVPPPRRESPPPEPKRESPPPPPKSEPRSEPKPDKPSSPPLEKSGGTKKDGR
jgi:hypothetical protein